MLPLSPNCLYLYGSNTRSCHMVERDKVVMSTSYCWTGKVQVGTAVGDTPGSTAMKTNSTEDCGAAAGVVVLCKGGRIAWFRGGPTELEVTYLFFRLLWVINIPNNFPGRTCR